MKDMEAVLVPKGEDLADAIIVLARLVYEEYPEKYTLAEIANTWLNGNDRSRIGALERVEPYIEAMMR